MIQIIPKEKRYFSDMWNMSSHFLFSFADYFNPENESFWNLRVFNDDFIKAWAWFPTHPHKYYEILTLIISWTITHKDSLWNKEKIWENQIQVTNTSTWIFHSEFNEEKEDLKLYQIWFSPPGFAKNPIYYTASYSDFDIENKLFTIASWIEKNSYELSSKISIKRWVFDAWQELEITPKKYFFLYITYWNIKLNEDKNLEEKYQLRAAWEEKIKLNFLQKTDFIVIESL